MIYVKTEDAALWYLVERILRTFDKNINLQQMPLARGVQNFKSSLPKLNEMAKTGFYCVGACDADENILCPAQQIHNWIKATRHPNLVVRLAVREAEAWMLADDKGFSEYFKVSLAVVRRDARSPEQLADPKKRLLELIAAGGLRPTRKEAILPQPIGVTASIGINYHSEIEKFINTRWCPMRASANAPSLQRAITAFRGLVERYQTAHVLP